MYYIYILYSKTSDKYYVGYSNDPFRRLEEHNAGIRVTFTYKHRPWQLKTVFECGRNEADAVRIEKFIKKQKSRKFIELLCNPVFVPKAELAQLVRVPHVRD